MGAITTLVVWAIRLTWFIMFGLWLGAAYALVMFCMSPFFTMASSRVFKNAQAIMFLKSDWD